MHSHKICRHPGLITLGILFGSLSLSAADLVGRTAGSTQLQGAEVTKLSERVLTSELTEHQHIEQFIQEFADLHGQILSVTNTYTVLATGMHYQEGGEWKNTEAVFEEFPDAFVARRGPTKAIVARRLGSQSVVDLLSSGGHRIQSAPHFIAYQDRQTGEQRSLAQVRPVEGRLVAPNTILFEDAFDGIRADVRMVYSGAGFECDLVLRERLSLPAGLDPATTDFQIYTEFTETEPTQRTQFDLPKEEIQRGKAQESKPPVAKATPAVAETDEIIEFGDLRMSVGTSFPTSSDNQDGVSNVRKTWKKIEERNFLIESIPHSELDQSLREQFPEGARLRPSNPGRNPHGFPQSLPAAPNAAASWQQRIAEIAWIDSPFRPYSLALAGGEPRFGPTERDAASAQPGYVVDWSVVNSAGSMTFSTGETYLVNGPVTLGGRINNIRSKVTIEPDVVIKYAPGVNASLSIVAGTDFNCGTQPYRPAQLLPRDDNSLGQTVSGSTGVVTGTYASTALIIDGTDSGVAPYSPGSPKIAWLRIRSAQTGTRIMLSVNPEISNLQFVTCDNAIRGDYISGANLFRVYNVLVAGGQNVFTSLYYSPVDACWMTIDISAAINAIPGPSSSVYLSGSTVVSAVNLTPPNVILLTPNSDPGFNFITYSARSLVFKSCGTAAYYLPPGSPLMKGAAALIPNAPETLFSLRLSPIVPRTIVGATPASEIAGGWNRFDHQNFGYSYPALDALCDNVSISGGALTLLPGGVVAVSGATGITVQNGGSFQSRGLPKPRPFSPDVNALTNIICPATSVGEQPAGYNGIVAPTSLIAVDTSSIATFAFTHLLGGASRANCVEFRRNGANTFNQVQIRDSRLSNVSLSLYSDRADQNQSLSMNNVIIERSVMAVTSGYYITAYPVQFSCYNALITGGQLALTWISGAGSVCTWNIRDNIFDTVAFSTSGLGGGGFSGSSHNAFYPDPGAAPDPLPGSNNKRLATLPFLTDLGWSYYYQDSCPPIVTLPLLADAGSRSASSAGLYHYTTTRSTCSTVPTGKELASFVDIGPHTLPSIRDADGDGLLDIVEDANQNGSGADDSSDFTQADTEAVPAPGGLSDVWEQRYALNPRGTPDFDGDGKQDFDEIRDGTNPADSANKIPGRLAIWKFNEAGSGGVWSPTAGLGQAESPTTMVSPLESIPVGQRIDSFEEAGASFPNQPGTTKPLRYPLSSGGAALVDLKNGTVRFWYSPDWLVGNAQGSPNAWCTLLDGGDTIRIWRLSVDPTGDFLVFQTPFGSGTRTNFYAPIPRRSSIAANLRVAWEITLNYSPAGSWISCVDTGATGERDLYLEPVQLPIVFHGLDSTTGREVDRISVSAMISGGTAMLQFGARSNGAGGFTDPAQGWLDLVESFNCTLTRMTALDNPPIRYALTPFGRIWDSSIRRQCALWAESAGTSAIRIRFYRAWEGSWVNSLPVATAPYRIERRTLGQDDNGWKALAINLRSHTFLDQGGTAADGTSYAAPAASTWYEYRISNKPGAQTVWGYAGSRPTFTNPNEPGYKVIVLLDQVLAQWDADGDIAGAANQNLLATKLSAYMVALRNQYGMNNVVGPLSVPRMNDEKIDPTDPVLNTACFDPSSGANGTYQASLTTTKGLINTHRDTTKTNLVVLIGHVAVPMSGFGVVDNHDGFQDTANPSHKGAWAADVWYVDLDGSWLDTQSRAFAQGYSSYPGTTLQDGTLLYQNLTNDKKYDENSLPGNQRLEAAVGRIDFSRMPSHKKSDESLRQTELRLTRDYLDKVNRYRAGTLTFTSETTVFAGEILANIFPPGAWADLSPLALATHVRQPGVQGSMPDKSYQDLLFQYYGASPSAPKWGFHGANGSWYHLDRARHYNPGYIALLTGVFPEQPGAFTVNAAVCVLSGSFLSDWYPTPGGVTIGDNFNSHPTSGFMKSCLAMKDTGLILLWNSHLSNGWTLQRTANGAPIGLALLESYEKQLPYDVRTTFILGDPTLTF